MKSSVMDALKAEQRKRFAAMTPDARLAMAQRLARRWLDDYCAAKQISRADAAAELRASRRAGRQPSRSATR